MPSLDNATGSLRVLVLPLTARDGRLTEGLLRRHGVESLTCGDMRELCREARAGAGAAIIAEEVLLADSQRRLEQVLADQPAWSDLPVVVLTQPNESEAATLSEWQRLANLTLLPRPVRIDQFLGVVRSRLRDRRRQYVVRKLLESLDQRGREFRQLADAMPQMVFIANRDGALEFLNQRAVDYLGVDPQRLGAVDTTIPIHPDDAERFHSRWVKALAAEAPFQCEFRALHAASGEHRWQLARVEPVRDPNGAVRQWYGACTEIHDRKLAEQQLAAALVRSDAASVAKSEFLANMSHEIRTPMTAILGYTELLAEQETDPEKRHSLEVIHKNGGFLLDIINDILDLSRIEAGKLEVAAEVVELRPYLREIETLLSVRTREKDVTFRVAVDESTPHSARVDPKRLRQILVNLIGNAIKFTDGGIVRLEVSCADRALRFAVKDTGIGMTREQVARLFQPFQQGDASVSRQFGGTGLGLAISQRLAHMLGGSISVWSEPGEGSEFTLLIDAGDVADCQTPPPRQSAANAAPAPNSLNDRRVLVVDDRPDVRHLTGTILRKAGAQVEYAENGKQATTAIARMTRDRRLPDIVLMDMQMPTMDGYEATKQLRSMGFREPIIALTADAMHGDMSRCLACGCNAYLSKPINVAEMISTLAYHLRRHAAAGAADERA